MNNTITEANAERNNELMRKFGTCTNPRTTITFSFSESTHHPCFGEVDDTSSFFGEVGVWVNHFGV